MSNELRALLARVEDSDPDTAKELRRHFDALQSRRQFGLNFERHTPESVALTGRPISVGDKVRFLPPRGETEVESKANWIVTAISGSKGKRVASLLDPRTKEETTRALEDLVFVADFRDPIYPGLVSTGKVERGGDKPFHAVINAENYHALEAMLFTYQGKVDCIYIDPPYNSGARDWKYNNDYVDGEDSYRHSKWLAFMERRLKIAKRLLNSRESVLIVTIDEKEYLRLGLLLEQTFPDARITMVSSSINSAGATRKGTFARAAEYLFFVQLGASRPEPQVLDAEWNAVKTDNKKDLYWSRLIRSGADSARADSVNQFYPVFVRDTDEGPVFVDVGEPYYGHDRSEVEGPAGTVAVWPIRKDGSEGRWRISAAMLKGLIAKGHARLGGWREGSTTVYYLKQGESAKVARGDFQVTGHRADGSVITDASSYETRFLPTDIWRITSHDAGNSGSRLISKLLPGRKFPFPKSLYAVEDALRFFVSDKPDALILDFFAGSGTTAHAVMRLNRQDGGRRRSISVTNNEVSADEQKGLVKKKLRPGHPDWEALGICDHITKPRIEAAITGRTPAGDPINGEYKFVDEFPMSDGFEENVEFFTLTYENAALVELDLAFERIAPLLWIRAGSEGRRIDARTDTFDVADTYAVLFNVDASRPFLAAVDKAEGLRVIYIVTDDETQYQAVAGQLPDGVESVRLYESYLRTFQINTGRA
ncbi:site-specific DNA-methyltransferase [Nocardia farcinica]|uniref:site-specific DNA-methyltransferase n=1 Tax=Nocardia farcinica TaxID=37329 RepID=UPI002457BECB|nr:DNA methyltransferase [Nocardia farcinica]